MGIDLIQLALVHHAPRISGRAFKVLARMAVTALDQPNAKGQPAGLYFGGWQVLALVIGQDPVAREKAAYEQTRRALQELEKAGLIERLDRPRPGTQQTYRLHLHPTETEGCSPPKQRGIPHRNGGNSPTETEGPRTNQGPTDDLEEDITPIRGASTTDRATQPDVDGLENSA